MTMQMRRVMARLTHDRVLAVLFLVAGILQAAALAITFTLGESVSALNAALTMLIGGGVVWAWQVLTGRLKDE